MAYTAGTLVTKVQQRIKDTGYSSSEIKNYLSDAQNDVFNEYRLPFMQTSQNYTVAAGVSDITNGSGLPTNYSQAIDLYLTSSGYEKRLPFTEFIDIDTMYPDPDDTTRHPANVPSTWYMYGETIKLYPVPLDAYTLTLRYYKIPTEITSDSDVPDVPVQFQELLVMGAAYRCMQAKDNYDQAAILQNKYDEILEKMVLRYSQSQVGSLTTMRINRYATGKTSF